MGKISRSFLAIMRPLLDGSFPQSTSSDALLRSSCTSSTLRSCAVLLLVLAENISSCNGLIMSVAVVASGADERVTQDDDPVEEPSIWESEPIEVDNANLQILDKVSGKVYRENLKLNTPRSFGSIELRLKRCFRNSPEDENEVFAFVEITEGKRVIFADWLFASSPSVNLFSHPIYDIRVEF